MSSGPPETLEQTQQRLAGRLPVPSSGQGTPFAGQNGPATEGKRPRKPRTGGTRVILAIVGSLVALFIVASIGSAVYFARPSEPVGGGEQNPISEPVNEEWVSYPGDAYRDDADVLAADSLEATSTAAAAFVEEYQAALTAQLGVEWTELTPARTDRQANGYGGESLLYSFDAGIQQGSSAVVNPDSRSIAMSIFEQISTAHGGDDFYLANDYDNGAADAEARYGAAELESQAVWTFRNSGSDGNGLRMSVTVYDSTLPVASTFTGASGFERLGPGPLFVEVFVYAYGQLSEADRDEYIERIIPFEGKVKPEPQ